MTLSLDDVRNKRFRMARKGGYEVLEVDEFVDEVEESFAQLVEENASLKKQVDALRSGSSEQAGDVAVTSDAGSTAPAAVASPQPDQPDQAAQAAQPDAGTAAPAGRVVVTTSAEASTAVVRLVQLSTEQAEHLVREATAEASGIRDEASRSAQQVTEDARTRAERLESEAKINAERVQAEAQTRSDSLDTELTQRRTRLFGDLDRQRESLTETVARLRDFEQKYRSGLQDHLNGQLSTLEHVGIEPEGGPERTAPRGSSTGSEDVPAATDAPADGEPAQGVMTQPEGVDESSAATPGSSETPRLDALLGEQR